jgi:indolepyruvate ferredoxin oxidoreductase alpha subunit
MQEPPGLHQPDCCPAFYLDGERVQINPNTCVGCAVCAQICPENAITPVKAKQAG